MADFRPCASAVDRDCVPCSTSCPISLGLPAGCTDRPRADHDKTTDDFFAGNVEATSTIRKAGMTELLNLRERGIRVDIPEVRLPPLGILSPLRASLNHLVAGRARLGTASATTRRSDAARCRSSISPIERYRPLIEGIHALYYATEPHALSAAIEHALADKDQLRAIARAGEAHVLAHHTITALARYVVETTLGSDDQPCQYSQRARTM